MSKKLQTHANALLKQGKSRQETYEILKEEHKLAKDVADALNYLPAKKTISKYRPWGIVQAVLLTILFSQLVFTAYDDGYISAVPTLVAIAYFGFLIQASARMQMKFYPWVTFLMIISIISGAVVMIAELINVQLYEAIGFFGLSIVVLALSIWIEKKVCPKAKEIKEAYTDSAGRQRLRLRYEFED